MIYTDDVKETVLFYPKIHTIHSFHSEIFFNKLHKYEFMCICIAVRLLSIEAI